MREASYRLPVESELLQSMPGAMGHVSEETGGGWRPHLFAELSVGHARCV